MRRVDETSGQAQRLVPSQWTEIDGREWCSATARAPRSVKRVALDPRSHDKEAGTRCHRRRKSGKMPENLRIGPMKILDNDQRWSAAAATRGERCCQLAFAAVTRGVIHGVIKRAPFACLRQVEQVMKKYEPFGRDGSLGDQTLGRTVSQFGFRGWRQAEQTQQQSADRVLSFAHAEIEHQAAMSGEARGFGKPAHLLDQPGFADSRLAAHVDDLADCADRGTR